MTNKNYRFNSNLLRLKHVFVFFTLSIILWSCSSKKNLKVEELKYELGGTFSSDTIILTATKPDVAWQAIVDQDWIILDSQDAVHFGSRDLMFAVLQNADTIVRKGKILIFGEDIDTIFLEIFQNPVGRGGVGNVQSSVDKKSVATTTHKASRPKKIKVEDNYADESDEFSVPPLEESGNRDESETPKIKSETPKITKNKIELSADEITVGAAAKLESAPIFVQAVGKWTIRGIDTIPWLKVINKDGKPLKQGSGQETFKIITNSANTTTAVREAVVEFVMGSTVSKLKVIQKPTEVTLTLDKTALNFDGEPQEPLVVKVSAVNTQWKIVGEIPTWLKVSPMEGVVGESVISVKSEINETGQARFAKIELVSTGDVIKKEINIVQDIQIVQLKITGPLEPINNKADSFVTFTVSSNLEWEIKKQEGENHDWYDFDIMNGTGGEDNLETVTITANQDNLEYDRSDTFFIIVKNVKRKVVVTQKGMKIKEVNIGLSVDTLNWLTQISNTSNFKFNLTINDAWTLDNPSNLIGLVKAGTNELITSGTQSENLELKLLRPKDSILLTSNIIFTFKSQANPEVTKTLTVKIPIVEVKKELKITGLTQGNFMPYIELGNITPNKGKNAVSNPRSKSIQVFSSKNFVIHQVDSARTTKELFYEVSVDKNRYTIGDVIIAGTHEITFKTLSDNVSKIPASRISLISFTIDNEVMPFSDNSNNKEGVLKFELKQEPLILEETAPKVFISNLAFNGYNSQIVLGNPKTYKQGSNSENNTAKKYVQQIKISTNMPIRIGVAEDKKQFFNINFGINPEKIKNEYKLGKTILPKGEYYFEFESKGNYTDPTGFQTANSMTLFIEKVLDGKESKTNLEEADAENSNKIIFIDETNKDFAGLHFRDVLLVEQESL